MRQKIKELTSSLVYALSESGSMPLFSAKPKANKVLIEYKGKGTLVVNNHQESLNA